MASSVLRRWVAVLGSAFPYPRFMPHWARKPHMPDHLEVANELLDDVKAVDSLLLQAQTRAQRNDDLKGMRMALDDVTAASEAALLAVLLDHPSSEIKADLAELHGKVTLALKQLERNGHAGNEIEVCLLQAKSRLLALGRSGVSGPRHD